jgi:hypothetical protein
MEFGIAVNQMYKTSAYLAVLVERPQAGQISALGGVYQGTLLAVKAPHPTIRTNRPAGDWWALGCALTTSRMCAVMNDNGTLLEASSMQPADLLLPKSLANG